MGAYTPFCIHCAYKGSSEDCNHAGQEQYTDNGNGTHKVTCKRCETVITASEKHTMKDVPVKSVVSGTELYYGQYKEVCEKCGYNSEEKTCDHKDCEMIWENYRRGTHAPRCGRCQKLLLDQIENCEWEEDFHITPANHVCTCKKCSDSFSEAHDFKGTRVITGVERGGSINFGKTSVPYWNVKYKENCKVCGAVRTGEVRYMARRLRR